MKSSKVECSKCDRTHKSKQEASRCGEPKKIRKQYNRNEFKNNQNE